MIFKYFNVAFSLFLICVFSVECAYDKLEGEPCLSESGVQGTCVSIFKCMSSVLDVPKKKFPPMCSFQGTVPVICCNDCELTNDTRLVIVDREGGIFFKSGQKARDKCIEHLKYLPYSCQTKGLERVWKDQAQCYAFEHLLGIAAVGGEDAERSSYPHMALLGYGSDEDSAEWLCGGSLISDQFVLTAAHCVSGAVLGPVRFIGMGILKRSDPDELWHVYNVKRIITHPDYDPPSKYHDIALLQTVRRVTFSKDVFPACLNYDTDPVNVQAYATGWGKLGKNRPLADNLQEVSLEEFAAEVCSRHFPPHRHLKKGYNHNMQMCYGDTKQPKDTCEGDSGGPLQVTSSTSRCLHTVVGVTSYGRACGYAGDAGMYTRVRHYVPWIESIVWKD